MTECILMKEMNNNLRFILHKKISQVLKNDKSFMPSSVSTNLTLKYEKTSKKFVFTLPLRSKYYDVREDVPNLLKSECNSLLEHTEINKNNPKELSFYVNRNLYIKSLLDSINQNLFSLDFLNDATSSILVDFSSPNIAKPFHVGHLRSTIIGNYIANINSYFKNNVKRINYLGDWGTQFGFVELGLSLSKISEESVKKDPINVLYHAYVQANKLAETDTSITDKAREIFRKLERGDESSISRWKLFRKYTLDELERTYDRIGIHFDEYQWESMYSIKAISNVLTELERLNLLTTDDKDRKVIQLFEKKVVPIVKSDGSSLYITRDIAAAMDRFEKYKFDAMYYVVDNAQTDHFKNLIGTLSAMKFSWANRLKHVKFGKIRGMSTRKGNVVFLQDILDETKIVMKEKQIQSPTTKVDLEYDDPSTETLGVSAVIVNDLKHKRNTDYEFNWDEALDVRGNTGVRLQYAHCRLVSLEKNSGAKIASECEPSLLTEPSVDDLVHAIGKFDEAVIMSYRELEPCLLVKYLFNLSHAINKALLVLRIKDEPSEIANQRLLLMHCARKVLAQGMRLLGLTPLEKM